MREHTPAHQQETDQNRAPRQDHAASAPVGSKAAQHANILQLQRQYGNQATKGIIQRSIPGFGLVGDDNAGGDAGATSSVSGSGGTISVDGGGVSITSNGPLDISAPTVTENVALHNNSGLLRTSTLLADVVSASTYTPGSGNIW